MHAHDTDHTAKKRLIATAGVTTIIMVAEGVGGWLSHSLSLMADAGHMLTDLLALLVSIAAITWASRKADPRRTYGYRRLEVLAALGNSIALAAIACSILVEAWQRWQAPQQVDVGMMVVVATVGLTANLLGLWLLGSGHHNLNLRSAFLHILGDTLSSAGVIVAAAVIALTGWTQIDPLLSAAISVVIVASTYRLLKEVMDVLLEAAPKGIDTNAVRATIGGVQGVQQVHDLHVWSITAGMPALSAHVVVSHPNVDTRAVLKTINERLRREWAIDHTTLQIEDEEIDHCGCE